MIAPVSILIEVVESAGKSPLGGSAPDQRKKGDLLVGVTVAWNFAEPSA
jgi:hypothetical protein